MAAYLNGRLFDQPDFEEFTAESVEALIVEGLAADVSCDACFNGYTDVLG